jgi:4-hydroxy-2-oxoheptanedioate aldolase
VATDGDLGPARGLAAALGLGTALRQRYSDHTLRGTFVIELPTPRTVRALALGGFDFLVLDLEHSPLDLTGLPALIAEGHACGTPVLVRPWCLEHGLIGKILGLGANGVLAPDVASPEQARAVVDAARYAPAGARGVCPLIGPVAADRVTPGASEDVLIVVQIEGREGLGNAAKIASTPGVDGVFVGPYDLAQALGAPGDVRGTVILDAAERIADATPQEVMLGVYLDDPTDSGKWSGRGFGLQCIGFDSQMLLERARDVVQAAQAEPAPVGRHRRQT